MTIYVFACLGAGKIIYYLFLKKFDGIRISAGTEAASLFLLGQGILASFWLLLALIGLFSFAIVKTITIVLFIFGLLSSSNLLFNLLKQITEVYKEFKKDYFEWKVLIILTTLICLAWVFSLARTPQGDASGFYLALAKVIAFSERLIKLPGYEDFTSIGLQGEMHFAALISIGSPESTQLFMWLTIGAGSILLLALGRKLGLKLHGQWLALVMVFTSSAIIDLSGSGKPDLFATAMAFAAYYWAVNINHDTNLSFLLTGLFAGLALVGKISYAITLIPSLVLIMVWNTYIQSRKNKFFLLRPEYIKFFIGISITVIPHLIKNQVLFENPFVPLGIDGIINQDWNGPETTKKILLFLPFALTFGDYWAQMGNLSPLVLMFLPLFKLLPKPEKWLQSRLVMVTIASIVGLVCWFLFRPSTFAPRYFMGCLLLLIIPTSRSAEFFINQQANKISKYLIIIPTILVIMLTGSYYSTHIFLVKETYDLLSGKAPNCQIDPNHCNYTETANNTLEPGERLFANDNLRYWLRADLIQCGLSSEETEKYLELDTSEQRWRYIIGRGFGGILVRNTLNPIANSIRNDIKTIPDWLEITIQQDERLIFIKLTSLEPQYKPLFACKQINPPAWNVISISD